MSSHVLEEARKCLGCKKPRCTAACPVSTEIPEVIRLLLSGDIDSAGEKLFNNNPLSVICSLVCPHEKQCEGNCVLNAKNNPVHFGDVENYISDFYIHKAFTKSKIDKEKRVAIIGSGPAGITISILLAQKGYNVTIFEAHDKIGGVLRYGIPEFRLSRDILDNIKEKLVEMGVKIRPNTMIGPYITIDDLFRDGYKAIFIGTGVWNPRTLNVKGETLGHVHYGIDYLKNPDVYDLGDRVTIIGAGNAAMDVARTAIRKGAKEVYVMYRKGEIDAPAEKLEVEYAKLDGVKFLYYKNPLEILDEGIRYTETKEVFDDEGNRSVIEDKGKEGVFNTNSVIIAVSQGPRSNIVSTTKGINTLPSGLVHVDEYGRTSRDGVFASGDVVTGAKTVVEAVRLSKKVAEAIEEYVTSN
ncbi:MULTISPECIES: NAD(P)-dependent oxidoreductase [Clostridium]|uniref:NADPH-dependent glutamate synthase n=1 Tax=Clostridium disporicum TaxID=84024 RepID=A0A174DEG4_9CLOT|nr:MULTISPECIES: NAD(P)-dependent oxidoreductase [Clostridium]MCD2500578.1 NAD(P)-dependent oxidoreductase [Clostridium sp. NSJ-145]MDU6340051.1 NAD(P)-dependent oxidoreductase [Clostridium sp.]CUO23597.1 NADPH-dependent glutamate synthase [Clostridium disporicum]